MERYPLIKKSSILDVPQGFEYISAKVVFLILFLLSLTERKDLPQLLLMTHDSFAKTGPIFFGNSVIFINRFRFHMLERMLFIKKTI